ncbi:hypothetical protein ACTJKO_14475 [Curtobacterium sp. 22159]|uniref:hypothetical protein n=1 Tax=Curtobacterium sp. 22159 TaxID=3453882 RepID=UPI003F86BD44
MGRTNWRTWLRNPLAWWVAIAVVGIVVGTVTLTAAIEYDGPSDVTCSREFGGNQSWVSCSDSAAGAAAAGALFGATSDVTVHSDGLLWATRFAFVPVVALGVWTIVVSSWKLVTGRSGSVRGRLRVMRRARRKRRRRSTPGSA